MVDHTQELRYETDILVVGAGSAGMWAAHGIKKKNKDVDVLVVDKAGANWGGLMACSGGDYDVVLPNENIDNWVKDWVFYYDGLCDQEVMETIWSQSYERLQEYQDWGCTYRKNDEGELDGVGVPQRGLKNIKLYVTKDKGSGGLRMTDALSKAIKDAGVVSIGRVHLTDLVKNKAGKVVGAVGFNIRDGRFVRIKAKAVLIATGLGSWKCSYMKNSSSGEGTEMAYRAGVELRNFEFARVWNVPKLFGWEGQTTLLPLGAKFLNAEGESFMERYCPALGCNTDPHYATLGMCYEVRAGRGPIYFNTDDIDPAQSVVFMPKIGWQKINYDRLKDDLGIDFFKSQTEWMPQPLMSYGGIYTDLMGGTCVDGLYAAGRCRSIDPGVYTGGFALSSTAITGHMTGQVMVDYLEETKPELEELDEALVEEYRTKMYAPLGAPGIPYKEVLRAIQSIIFPYEVSILKSEASLKNALHKLETLKKEALNCMGAPDSHYLMKLKETECIAFTAELFIKASLMRTESRAGHFREDYPDHNDSEWLKWIIIKRGEDGEPEFRTERVPMERYKHPIEGYYQDQFNFNA